MVVGLLVFSGQFYLFLNLWEIILLYIKMSIFPPLFSRETYVYDFEHFVVTNKNGVGQIRPPSLRLPRQVVLDQNRALIFLLLHMQHLDPRQTLN